MSLNDLPIEIADKICLTLRHRCTGTYCHGVDCDPASKKALLNLSRTSKKLYQIALPHLYYRVVIDNRVNRPVPFTRLLFDNPHLADLIHEIYLGTFCEFEHDQTLQKHFSAQSPPLPEESMRADGTIKGANQWYTIHVLDTLLTKARNLEHIDFTEVLPSHGIESYGFAYIRDKHATNAQFLCRLREVVVRYVDNNFGFNFESIVPLLSGSHIQSLTLWRCIGITDFGNCSFPSLLTLKILDSTLSRDSLARIIAWSPILQQFYYTTTDEAGDDDATREEVTFALFPLRKSLRILLLDLLIDGVPSSDPIGPLVNFSQLESLTINMMALTGEMVCYSGLETQHLSQGEVCSGCLYGWLNKIPSSLQNLKIIAPKGSACQEFPNLAKRANIDFPTLRTLTVDEPLGLAALFQETSIKYVEVEPVWLTEDLDW